MRVKDAWGYGHFGAPRGMKTHKGIDFLTENNERIYAPFDCKIVRYGYPYANDDYRLVEIQGLGSYSEFKAKIMYINPTFDVGTTFTKGNFLCTSAKINDKYDETMKNHVHFELYKNGVLENPTKYF